MQETPIPREHSTARTMSTWLQAIFLVPLVRTATNRVGASYEIPPFPPRELLHGLASAFVQTHLNKSRAADGRLLLKRRDSSVQTVGHSKGQRGCGAKPYRSSATRLPAIPDGGGGGPWGCTTPIASTPLSIPVPVQKCMRTTPTPSILEGPVREIGIGPP
eukprot:756058-Hanusia_phi.AAC.2